MRKRFTIRLANGKQEEFDSAGELAGWVARQRGLDYPRRRRIRPTSQRREPEPSKFVVTEGEAPLARFATQRT